MPRYKTHDSGDGKTWACDNFKASEDDPSFCAHCSDLASMHKGPTPGAPRSFRMTIPIQTVNDEHHE